MLIFYLSIQAQQKFSSDNFTGDWYSNKSEYVKVKDTVVLLKEYSDKFQFNYSKWTFSKSNIYNVTLYISHTKSEKDMETIQENKPIDDKWSFDSNKNELYIRREKKEKIFKVISHKEKLIKLVRTK